jgi:MOB kinase activator 1
MNRVAHGTRYEYLWEDGVKYRRPTKLPAPQYVDALMNWVQNLLDDEAIFPNKIGSTPSPSCASEYLNNMSTGVPFPKNFRDTVRTIIRRLFRVYAHIYSNHFDHICALGIEGMRFNGLPIRSH